VVEVYAAGANRGDAFFRDAGDVDVAVALLTLSDGAFAHVSASRYNAHGYDVRLEVLGSKRSIAVGLDDHLPVASVEPGVAFPAGTPHAMFMQRFAAAYAAELEAFLDVVAGKALPACTIEDSLEASLIAEACERSRHERRPVRMADVRSLGNT
jgi:myo-inositol 2-dehydrogenase/D-chiro-inositol 1-dehydrogenase